MLMKIPIMLILATGTSFASCQQPEMKIAEQLKPTEHMDNKNASGTDTATFGNGCFWCTEAIFESLNGVESAVSGYSGGTTPNPDYKEVCTGQTGHAEAVQIVFNPGIISYEELLEAFWASHDPTTLNRQGNDVGT